jgi:hypothetical protein
LVAQPTNTTAQQQIKLSPIILSILCILTQVIEFYLKLNTLYICKLNSFSVLCNISFKEYLPEDGHSRWPKPVAVYADYDTINK